jgi:hypothetical protein
MARFPLFLDVIHNQNKHIKTSLGHPQMKCRYNYSDINKSKKNMVFHGFADHAWDYLITKLSSTKKGNSTTLTNDKPFPPHIFSGV